MTRSTMVRRLVQARSCQELLAGIDPRLHLQLRLICARAALQLDGGTSLLVGSLDRVAISQAAIQVPCSQATLVAPPLPREVSQSGGALPWGPPATTSLVAQEARTPKISLVGVAMVLLSGPSVAAAKHSSMRRAPSMRSNRLRGDSGAYRGRTGASGGALGVAPRAEARPGRCGQLADELPLRGREAVNRAREARLRVEGLGAPRGLSILHRPEGGDDMARAGREESRREGPQSSSSRPIAVAHPASTARRGPMSRSSTSDPRPAQGLRLGLDLVGAAARDLVTPAPGMERLGDGERVEPSPLLHEQGQQLVIRQRPAG